VIQVRVRQNDRVELHRIERQRLPVPLTERLQPLKQATVDQNQPPAELE